MPYSIDPGHPDCEGFAVVKDTDGSVMGCHRTRTQAERQVAALYAAEPELDDDEERAESYKPTAAMIAEARRGLDWREEFGRGGTAVGVARARDISNGRELPLDTVNRMVSYFARHEVDKNGEGFSPGEDGYPSAGRIAWALWGGDPGQTWANAIAKENRDELETAVIVDIDGTLLLGNRYNETLVDRLNMGAEEVQVVTGRPERRRVETERLLEDMGLDYDDLYMNPGGDDRAHKRATAAELLEEYDVRLAIDNDEQARAAYRSLGIPVENPNPDTRSAYDQAVAILARLRSRD